MGYWSSIVLVVIGIGYVIALAAGFARHGFSEPITDPVLAVMEVLTLLSAPAIVCLAAAIYSEATADRKLAGLVGVAFTLMFAGITSAVHFAELTAGRQAGDFGIAWPSRVYAVELLAWDVFLGISFIALAATFARIGARRRLRNVMMTCGWLCLVGTVGPVVGNMRLQLIGVFGYAVVLPFAAFLLMRHFGARNEAPT
jgi:hypothetical protein